MSRTQSPSGLSSSDPRTARALMARLNQLHLQLSNLADDFTEWAVPRITNPLQTAKAPEAPQDPLGRKWQVDALLDRYEALDRHPHRSAREKPAKDDKPGTATFSFSS